MLGKIAPRESRDKKRRCYAEYNGAPISDPAMLRNLVAGTAPSTEVTVKLLREGKAQTVKVTIGELPASLQKISKEYDNLLKGAQVQDLTPEIRKEMNIPKHVNGVIVANIEEAVP